VNGETEVTPGPPEDAEQEYRKQKQLVLAGLPVFSAEQKVRAIRQAELLALVELARRAKAILRTDPQAAKYGKCLQNNREFISGYWFHGVEATQDGSVTVTAKVRLRKVLLNCEEIVRARTVNGRLTERIFQQTWNVGPKEISASGTAACESVGSSAAAGTPAVADHIPGKVE